MKHLSILFTSILLLVTALFAHADGTDLQNDPTINPDANACFEGGSKAGICETDIEWIAGWFLIRLETEVYTYEDVPDFLYWMLPADYLDEDIDYSNKVAKSKQDSIYGRLNLGGCYARPEGDWSFDAGKKETNDNLTWHNGSDCNSPNGTGTIVSGSDRTEAEKKCEGLGEPGYAEEMDNYGASGNYLCNSG